MTPEVDVSSELAEARRRLQLESLVEISPVAIVVMDADERVTGWNPAAAELFGYSPQEAIGHLIDDLVLNEDLRREGRDVTHEARERGRADRITRRVRKDGELVDVTASTSASTRSTTTSPSSNAHESMLRRSWP
jgi:PAS domain S-box-containing protein